MAIVSISRIQHRRGLHDDLGPTTLASAELGWSVDTRQLFIGNGTLEEGAPTVGRTEILTEYSDILGLFASYVYKGQQGGYTVQTGPSAGADATRSLQGKLDDFVNLLDFVTTQDAASNDYTVAINRALDQLFCQQTNTEVRRVLYIPAGIYPITGKINIPTYATILGDGKESTIIRQIGSDQVFELSDSLNQVETNIGNNSATRPSYIDVRDLTFQNTQDELVGTIFAAEFCRFTNVLFKGNRLLPTDQGIGDISILAIGSTPVLNTRNIYFDQCGFTNGTYVARLDDDMRNIIFSACYFDEIYKPFKVGELTDGITDSRLVGPENLRIMNSNFERVASTAIQVFSPIKSFTSAFNYYRNVATAYGGAGNPTDSIIIFEDDNNMSIGDVFDRDDTDELVYPRVEHTGTNAIVQYPGEFHFGGLHQKTAVTATLLDNQANALTGIEVPTSKPVMYIDYTIRRVTAIRIGTIRIVQLTGTDFQIEDDFVDNNVDAGVTFSISNSGDGLLYTTTGTGTNAEFVYAIRYFN